MNFYELLLNRGQPSGEGMTHFERLFAAKLAGGGEIKELEGVPPLLFKANGESLIDWSIYGNTVQSGTPAPQSPVMPNGTGERTNNLINSDTYYGSYKQSDGTYQTTRDNLYDVKIKPFTSTDIGKTFTFSANISPTTGNTRLSANINGTVVNGSFAEKSVLTFTVETINDSIFFNYDSGTTTVTTLSQVMLNTGSTALPYEPYGYKLTVSSANTTTPVYLGEVESTRRIKKLVLDGTGDWSAGTENFYRFIDSIGEGIPYSNVICTHAQHSTINNNGKALFIKISDFSPISSVADFKSYLAQQYAAGTPVTVWYVLATEQTAVVNEPLMKIGDYADSLTATQAGVEIPTIKGNNTIDIDTTVKPSNVYIKYKD